MSAYDYEHFVKDFVSRTKKNLKVINDITGKQSDIEAYEITQLINSLLGLLIIPYEHNRNLTEKMLMDKNGYKEVRTFINNAKIYSNYPEDKNGCLVVNFIKHLRNALAHNRMLFLDEEQQLSGVIFYDFYHSKKNGIDADFCIQLDLSNLKTLVNNILLMYESFNDEFDEKYHNRITKKQELLNGK